MFFKEIKITRLFSKVTKLTKQGMAKKKEEKTQDDCGHLKCLLSFKIILENSTS